MNWSILAVAVVLGLLVYLTYNPRKPLVAKTTSGQPKATGPAEVKRPTWQKKGDGPGR
jgi:hypothetical protein